MKISLQKVHYMPKELKQGILYVSEEFSTAAHLCACGCGSKIRTPLGPTEWAIEETSDGPSLWPSIGNWQLACKSHYIISRGEIQWAERWTNSQILAGRNREEKRREIYYKLRQSKQKGSFEKFLNWLKQILG